MSAEATIRTWMDTAVEAIKRAEAAEAALVATQDENRRLKAELAEFDEANRMMVKHADIRRAELGRLREALAPFAKYAAITFAHVNIRDSRVEIGVYSDETAEVTAGDFRRAARAFDSQKDQPNPDHGAAG